MLLWEKEPLSETAARLRDVGITVAVFDPCANRPGSGNYYLTEMETSFASLEEAFAPHRASEVSWRRDPRCIWTSCCSG